MVVDPLLARLSGVRKTGNAAWRAKCPAHDSAGLTLAIKEGDGGAVLLHCFAGCGVKSVVESIGMSLSDLFPPKPEGFDKKSYRMQMDAKEALECLGHETKVILCMVRDKSVFDAERWALATRRIEDAICATTRGRL